MGVHNERPLGEYSIPSTNSFGTGCDDNTAPPSPDNHSIKKQVEASHDQCPASPKQPPADAPLSWKERCIREIIHIKNDAIEGTVTGMGSAAMGIGIGIVCQVAEATFSALAGITTMAASLTTIDKTGTPFFAVLTSGCALVLVPIIFVTRGIVNRHSEE